MLKFFRAFANVLNMRLYFILGYYPEADGQTEYTNQMLKQFLRIYYNYQQLNWSWLLLLAEFTYNNISSATTDIFFFFVNKSYHSQMQL